MDPAVSVEPNEPVNTQLDGAEVLIGEKRPVENGEEGELAVRLKKKARCGPGDMKRVAEIVLVLSTMARMRGGRKPTEAELGLMQEARSKLVEICQELAPKDIVARDAIGAVIEDLGLNGKVKDQRLGYRGPKLSIAEKVLLTKRKMEESKKFTAQSGTYTTNTLQTSGSAAAESRGTPHVVRMFPSDKISHASISSGGFPAPLPPGHASAAPSTSLSYQLPSSEVRASTVSTGLPSSHLGRDSSSLALPRVERAQIKLDGGSNGPSYTLQVQANSSANHPLVNAPTWSVQPQSASSAKPGPENKVSNHHHPAKVEGAADLSTSRMASQVARDQTFRPFITQTASGSLPGMHRPLQSINFVQAPSFCNNHGEIAKVVQRLLQPQLPEHPTWTPPSREYMNKALTCQTCKLTINEVETVLLCDGCEKGYHLKCLQSNNQKGIPRAEWHCMRCVALCNGKPLPPKYGRVMRSITTPKMPNTAGVQSSSEKKVGTLDPKVSQQKVTENGSSSLQSSAGSVTVSTICVESATDLKIPNASEMQGSNFSSSGKDMDQRTFLGTCADNSMKSLGAVSVSPSVGTSSERSIQHAQISESYIQHAQISESSTPNERFVSGSKSQSPAILSDTVGNKSDHSQPLNNSQDARTEVPNCAEVPLKNCDDNNPTVKDSEKSYVGGDYDCSSRIKQDERDGAQADTVESSGPSPEVRKHAGLSLDGLHRVEWIGDILQVEDGKKFYQSCSVDGVTYKLQDHALFHSNHDKLIPSKLQALWEDIRTGSKWVIINRYYFPGDLPEAVGRPGTPESNEVYESNNDSTEMAGLIQGLCEVLPASKFKEENERQSQLGTEANKGRRPIFLCKWLYDKFKGSFQPVCS